MDRYCNVYRYGVFYTRDRLIKRVKRKYYERSIKEYPFVGVDTHFVFKEDLTNITRYSHNIALPCSKLEILLFFP